VNESVFIVSNRALSNAELIIPITEQQFEGDLECAPFVGI